MKSENTAFDDKILKTTLFCLFCCVRIIYEAMHYYQMWTKDMTNVFIFESKQKEKIFAYKILIGTIDFVLKRYPQMFFSFWFDLKAKSLVTFHTHIW